MAQQTDDTLKSWYETGDYPTQQQFWDWIDSKWNKLDGIPMSSILGLSSQLQTINAAITNLGSGAGGTSLDTVLPAGTASWDGIGATLVEKIWIVGDEELTGFAVGTDVDTDDIISFRDISANPADRIISIDLILNSDTTLYFSGITSSTVLKLYNR